MSINLRITACVIVIGAYGTGAAALGNETTDPHQRARDMIIPTSVSLAPVATGSMGRLIGARDDVDPHFHAAGLIKHDQEPRVLSPAGVHSVGTRNGYPDPQLRAQSMILGRHE